MKLTVHRTAIPEVLIVEHEPFRDDRGFLMEAFNATEFAKYADLGLPSTFVQLNHSRSVKGVTRGLHFQWDPPMGKYMRVARGEAFLVAVDIRPGSPTLGEHVAVVANDENHLALWAPACFARGLATLSVTSWTWSTSSPATTTARPSPASPGTIPHWASTGRSTSP